MNEGENEPVQMFTVDNINIIIPQCCREGWDDCPHAVHKEREKPKNVAL